MILALFLFYYLGNEGNNTYRASVIKRGHQLMSADARSAMLAALQSSDPAFDPRLFYARISEAFRRIQKGWSLQALDLIRAFVSDGVYERFTLQIDEQKALGFRNEVDNVAVLDTEIVQVFCDQHFEQVAVRIVAQADDQDVAIDTGRVLKTNTTQEFAEVWSYLRRRGAKTRPDLPGLIEGHCPNCGAPIEMNQNANCAHCKALLRSGEYDWVLCEITQDSEWRPVQTANLPGVAQLISRDRDFNLQELEDRASVMFWRHNASMRMSSIAPLRSVASRDFLANHDVLLRTHGGEGRSYFGECAVGSVETWGVVSDNTFDRALVTVHWSGTRFVVNDDVPYRTANATLTRSVLVLARRAGVQTKIEQAISSAHCPNCGAPATSGETTGACPFCGTLLNDGAHGWVLDGIISPDQARDMLRQVPPPLAAAVAKQAELSAPSAAGLIAWMTLMATADGVVSPKEMEMLLGAAARHRVPRWQVDEMIRAGLRNQLDTPRPQTIPESRAWLRAMAMSALADGTFNRAEETLLHAAGGRLGFIAYDIEMLLKELKAEMYATAKDALRARDGR